MAALSLCAQGVTVNMADAKMADGPAVLWAELKEEDAALVARAQPAQPTEVVRPRRQRTEMPTKAAHQRASMEEAAHQRERASIDAVWEQLKESDRLSTQRDSRSTAYREVGMMDASASNLAHRFVAARSSKKRPCEKLDLGMLSEDVPFPSSTDTVSPFKRLRL